MRAITGLKTENYPQLIPVFRKPERKLLSVLMAVLDIVPRFRGQLLNQCGYGAGISCKYQSFMEPHYEFPHLPNRVPDGLMVCTRGQATWSAFIEAKADNNAIRPEQIQEYSDFAAELNVDAVISISNEHALTPTDLPYHLASNKRRKRSVFHLSWTGIRTEIELFLNSENGCDPAEIAILKQTLSFMRSPRSGVEAYDTMPKNWSAFVESANTAIGFNANTLGFMEIVRGWQQERRDLREKLKSETGDEVELRNPAGARASLEDITSYDKKLLADDKMLRTGYLFKKSKCHLGITSDLRACSHAFTLEIMLPDDKQEKATINWLAKKLFNLSADHYQVIIDWPGVGNEVLVPLNQLFQHPDSVYEGQKSPPKSVWLARGHRNVRRFKNRKRFIEDLEGTARLLVSDATQIGIITK